MNTLRLLLGVLLLTVAQIAPAIQPAGAIPSGRSGPAAGEPIERGGKIDAIDRTKASITVDGVSYSMPAGSARIHLMSGEVTGRPAELKVGMQIRFSTVQPYASSPVQVREIWVTGPGRRSAKP